MSAFDGWMEQNAPHVYKHRDGPLASTYASYLACWNAALRLAVTPPGEPTRLCIKCGATYGRTLTRCPLCEAA